MRFRSVLLAACYFCSGHPVLSAAEAEQAVTTAVEADPPAAEQAANTSDEASVTDATTAAQAAPLRIDADAAVRLASAHLESILAARARQAAAGADARADLARLLPQLNGRLAWQKHGDRYAGDLAVEQDGEDWLGEIRLDQVLYQPGLIGATNDLRRARRQRAAADLATTQRDIELAVRQTVAAYALAEATVAITDRRIKQRQQEQTRIDLMAGPQVGMASSLDVGQARLNLIAAEQEHRQATNDRHEQHLQVARLIALDAEDFALTVALDQQPEPQPLLERAAVAIGLGPAITALQAASGETLAGGRLAHAQDWPRLGVFAQANSLGDQFDERNTEWVAGIGISWQIYDGGAARAQYRASRMRAEALRLQAQDLARDRARLLDRLTVRLASIAERLTAAEGTVTIAQQNYEAAKQQFENGLIDLTRLGEFSLAIGEQEFQLAALRYQRLLVINQLQALTRDAEPDPVIGTDIDD